MRKALATLALGLLFVGACSRISLGWRAAPWLLEREAAEWLGLDSEERKAFGLESRAWLKQNGAHLAPKLGLIAHSAARDLRMGHDHHVIEALFVELPKLWDQALAPALPPLAAWLAQRPEARALALQKTFDERNARDQKRYADPSRSVAAREKRLRSSLKEWVGNLSPEQLQGLEQWARDAEFPSQAWMADRQQRQAALIKALRPGVTAVQLQAQLDAWWLTPEKDRDPAYQHQLEAYRGRVKGATARLLGSLRPDQREHLAARLQALGEDFEAIGLKSLQK